MKDFVLMTLIVINVFVIALAFFPKGGDAE